MEPDGTAAGDPLTPALLLKLQRQVGNQAVLRLLRATRRHDVPADEDGSVPVDAPEADHRADVTPDAEPEVEPDGVESDGEPESDDAPVGCRGSDGFGNGCATSSAGR